MSAEAMEHGSTDIEPSRSYLLVWELTEPLPGLAAFRREHAAGAIEAEYRDVSPTDAPQLEGPKET